MPQSQTAWIGNMFSVISSSVSLGKFFLTFSASVALHLNENDNSTQFMMWIK